MQEIICVLDKSASMRAVAIEAKNGFNHFIEEQKKLGEANLTVIFFDNTWECYYHGKLSEYKSLDNWPAGGFTALYDAIGKTIHSVKDRFSREKPEKVIMAILTDGFNNASVEFNEISAGELVREHQEKYGWEVIYLGADQDAWAVAQTLNIPKQNVFNYASSNTRAAFGVMGQSVSSYRS